MVTLSEYIKQKRKKYGLSQVELAERAGVGLRFVRDFIIRCKKFAVCSLQFIFSLSWLIIPLHTHLPGSEVAVLILFERIVPAIIRKTKRYCFTKRSVMF